MIQPLIAPAAREVLGLGVGIPSGQAGAALLPEIVLRAFCGKEGGAGIK